MIYELLIATFLTPIVVQILFFLSVKMWIKGVETTEKVVGPEPFNMDQRIEVQV